MQPTEALSVVAQVAVTLAGFAGIVVVFRPESLHHWSAVDKFRLRLLLANSALPLAYSLFAIFLLSFEPPPMAIWRWCSAVAFASAVVFTMGLRKSRRQVTAAEFQTVNQGLYYSLIGVAIVALVLQMINLAVWNRFWPFCAVLLVHLIAAIAQFIRMILVVPR